MPLSRTIMAIVAIVASALPVRGAGWTQDGRRMRRRMDAGWTISWRTRLLEGREPPEAEKDDHEPPRSRRARSAITVPSRSLPGPFQVPSRSLRPPFQVPSRSSQPRSFRSSKVDSTRILRAYGAPTRVCATVRRAARRGRFTASFRSGSQVALTRVANGRLGTAPDSAGQRRTAPDSAGHPRTAPDSAWTAPDSAGPLASALRVLEATGDGTPAACPVPTCG